MRLSEYPGCSVELAPHVNSPEFGNFGVFVEIRTCDIKIL